MRWSMKVLLGVSLISTVSTIGCAPPKSTAGSPVVNDVNLSTTELIARLNASTNEQTIGATLAALVKANPNSVLARGGAGGKVTLSDAVAANYAAGIGNVLVESIHGYGATGVRPDLKAEKPVLVDRTAAEAAAALGGVESSREFVNLGCLPYTAPIATDGLVEKPAFGTEQVPTIRAKIVQICREPNFKAFSAHIVADRIVLKNVKLRLEGSVARQFSMTARELTLIGDSVIETKGKNGITTIDGAPGVTINAAVVTGNGRLSIHAEGSSYVPADAVSR